MISDKILKAWKRWISLSIVLPVELRDSDKVKKYPGIYIADENTSRKEIGGIIDGNVFAVEWKTYLITTPGEDSQIATSESEHDTLREIVSDRLNDCNAETWMDSQLGIRVFQLLITTPETNDENGYRVTSWQCSAICCSI
jgi:hypothetical protein